MRTTREVASSCDPPDLLTVEEMAAVMRIGRSSAYTLVRQYLATNGDAGLPVIRVGNLLRVPRPLLEQMLGGPITWPPADVERTLERPQPTRAAQARRGDVTAADDYDQHGRLHGGTAGQMERRAVARGSSRAPPASRRC